MFFYLVDFFINFFFDFFFRIFSVCFDTSGSMILRLVPEISSLDAFCDGRAGAAAGGIGDSRKLILDPLGRHHSCSRAAEIAVL